MKRQQRARGRYDAIREASHPGPELPAVNLPGRIVTVVAAVADPNPALGEKLRRQRVAVNKHADALEMDYAYGRLSPAAYATGRVYQSILEACSGLKTEKPVYEPSAGAGDRDTILALRLDRVETSVEMQYAARRAIGQWAELVVREILGGLTIRDASEKLRHPSKRGRAYIAETFREGLEDLAVHWERHGRF